MDHDPDHRDPKSPDFIRAYEASLFAYAFAMLRNAHDASEIVNDTFLAAMRQPERFAEASAVKQWLFGIARNKLFAHLRRQNKVRNIDSNVDVAAETDPALELLLREELINQLKRCIESLKEKQRLAIELFYDHDLEYDEIARELELTVAAVGNQLSRAKQSLRQCLKPYWGEGYCNDRD
jgi:RNA polymerase sigma factor (sigma-70 family)